MRKYVVLQIVPQAGRWQGMPVVNHMLMVMEALNCEFVMEFKLQNRILPLTVAF